MTDPATAPANPCAGFPDHCPYLLTVEPSPPHHDGGVRCGCNARQDLEDMAFELATGAGLVDPREHKATLDRYADQILAQQPSLRTCLYPGCIRQYDAMAAMSGRKPANPSWSGTGWKTVPRGPASGALCPDHVDIVTAHLPRTVDIPNGRWMAACVCGWTSRPQTYGGLLKPLWEEHLLIAAGTLPAPSAPEELFERTLLDEMTQSKLNELYDFLEDAEHDQREAQEAAQAFYRSWEWHRHALAGVARAVNAVCNMVRVDSRHWAATRGDALLWAILIGWDDEALTEVAAKHQWNEHRTRYVREMHALLAPTRELEPPIVPDSGLRQAAYDAVFAYLRTQPRDSVPTTVVDRNAMIWRAVHAALDAAGIPTTDQQPEED